MKPRSNPTVQTLAAVGATLIVIGVTASYTTPGVQGTPAVAATVME